MTLGASSECQLPAVATLPFGAAVLARGVRYRVWAPGHEVLWVEITRGDGSLLSLPTQPDGEGFRCALHELGTAGDRYQFRLADGSLHADPASRAQADSVTGKSVVVDPSRYPWRDGRWQRPAFRDLVIYELHVGTFTPEGTFAAAAEKLPYLRDLGISAIELMPVGDWAGTRNWGYDGVLIYAPARPYGSPDDLRSLVDAAHAHGIAVIQDVVYNHFGPDGSSMAALAPSFFNPQRPTPWGAAFNFDGDGCSTVREFFLRNAIYWLEEFHMDGVRLDATHTMLDTSEPHILADIAAAVRARGAYVIAEDERNDARLVTPATAGGTGLNAVWADDLHHTLRVSQTQERHAYYQDFTGTLGEVVDTLKNGRLYRGQRSRGQGHARGTQCAHLPPEAFVVCISNHDQVGNQALGTRLSTAVSVEAYRALSMLLCLTPYSPMLFMGQEWAASTPYLYFTDHHEGLGSLIRDGRRREFSRFPGFADEARRGLIPDPQAESTFLRSKLDWREISTPPHAGMKSLYAACLHLRQTKSVFRPARRAGWDVGAYRGEVGWIWWHGADAERLLLFHLWPRRQPLHIHLKELPWQGRHQQVELVLSSNAHEFGGPGCGLEGATLRLAAPESVLLAAR